MREVNKGEGKEGERAMTDAEYIDVKSEEQVKREWR